MSGNLSKVCLPSNLERAIMTRGSLLHHHWMSPTDGGAKGNHRFLCTSQFQLVDNIYLEYGICKNPEATCELFEWVMCAVGCKERAACTPCAEDAVMCCSKELSGRGTRSPSSGQVGPACWQLSAESHSRDGPLPKGAASPRCPAQLLLLLRAVRPTPLDSVQGTEGLSQLQSSLGDRSMPLLGHESERESCSVVFDSLRPCGLYSPWNSPGQNTGVGSRSLLQGIFPTQGLNPGLPHCRWILYHLSHQGRHSIPPLIQSHFPYSCTSVDPEGKPSKLSARKSLSQSLIPEAKLIYYIRAIPAQALPLSA